jgi:nucleoside-diphosphate-sugar epimerase
LVEKLVKIVGSPTKPQFGVLPDRLFEPARKADVSDTFEKLGWRAKISLESGLEGTVEWYKAQINFASNARSTGILSAD